LAFVDKTPLPTPEMSLAYHLALRNRHLRENPGYLEILDGSRQLNDWVSLRQSKLIIIKGTFQDRGKARHIAASIVAVARQSQYPIVWILTPRDPKSARQFSTLDILKHLVLQILQKNKSLLDGRSHPLAAKDFYYAATESEWFDLLGLVLEGIAEIYVVIDIEILRGSFGDLQLWPSFFVDLFQKLAQRSPNSIVKVAIISYHTQLAIESSGLTQKNVFRLNRKGRQEKLVPRKSSGFQISSNRRCPVNT
jgi:hypothetical protein